MDQRLQEEEKRYMGFWCCDVMIRSSVLHLSFDVAILFGAVYASLMVLYVYLCCNFIIFKMVYNGDTPFCCTFYFRNS